jgi:hypothetical protein
VATLATDVVGALLLNFAVAALTRSEACWATRTAMPVEEFITVAPKGPSSASKAWLEAELLLLLALFAPLKSVAAEAASTLLPFAWAP